MDQPLDLEQTLDPTDWPAFRELCHRMLDTALDQIEQVEQRPVWRPVPAEVKQALDEPLPLGPQDPRAICDDIRRLVLPFATGNTHPRFFGWVHGAGTAGGVLSELVAAAMNCNLGGREHSPVYVERQVIRWCRRLFGFPETASGLLVSGTSMATLIALAVARNSRAGHDVKRDGLGSAGARLTAYCSTETHSCTAKALQLLGLGSTALRAVPVDPDYRMSLTALQAEISADRAAGRQPFCVIGTAGTVNCGAIDDLAGLAEISAREDLWFHVDGAFGALAIMSESLKPRLAGIERADSLAFDFHKWAHVPYDAGCVLIRDEALHRETFSERKAYLAAAPRGLAGGNPLFCEYGPELSRGFRALKVWFTLKEHGTERLGAAIARNCRQAQHLASLVEAHPRLALMAPVGLNIVCFRYSVPGMPNEALDRLNGEIVADLQELGIAAPSTTRLADALVIRVNITNHRSRFEDFDRLIDAVATLGARHASRHEPAAAESPLGTTGQRQAVS